ncbi:hypothetical protein BGZ68_002529 [Mortierella alpina]|nr:hypothetical protein BGZ68_002529 [Mortierella alpina]
MKFTTTLVLIVACIAVAAAHGGMLYPTPRGGYGTPEFNGRFHSFLGFKDKKQKLTFPCGGYAPVKKPTRMEAGKVIDVRFYASDMNEAELRKQPKLKDGVKQFKQARHGGGMCEFSLSYDNGKTFHLIGRYTETCPDSYFTWPVKIPDNVKECKQKNKCLFVWTWTANILPQFYMNCADILLLNEDGKQDFKSKESVRFYDFKDYPKRELEQGVRAVGDGIKHRAGKGPIKKEKDMNTQGILPAVRLIGRKKTAN